MTTKADVQHMLTVTGYYEPEVVDIAAEAIATLGAGTAEKDVNERVTERVRTFVSKRGVDAVVYACSAESATEACDLYDGIEDIAFHAMYRDIVSEIEQQATTLHTSKPSHE